MFLKNQSSGKIENAKSAAAAQAGFTLVEVMVSAAIMVLIALGVVPALLQLNTYASSARLQTMASLIALNQVELASTDAPFSPPDAQIPVELIEGTQTAPVIIYDDPNSEMTISGTMTTVVEDPNYQQNSHNLNLRKVTVTISYQYRNRSYTVRMRTIRASDV